MRTPRLLRAGVAAALGIVLAGGCSGSDGDGASRATVTTSAPAVAGAELAGRWAHYDIVAYEDASMKTMIVSYGFTDFAVEDGRLVESEQFCTADQISNLPIETSISDRATQAIRPPSTPVDVSGGPGTWRVVRPATPTPVGIRLADPANEKLPSDPRDPRIVDDDGDGKPGITVQVGTGGTVVGELYLARREIFAYDLTQSGPDTMRGTVKDSSEQLLIDASIPALLSTGGQWTQVTDLRFSPIELRRVGREWDCTRLSAELGTLFEPPPAIGW